MTRRWKFITILAVGTSVTATGLGVGLGVGLHSSWTTNVQWYKNGVLSNEQSNFKNKNLMEIIKKVFKYDEKNQMWLYSNQEKTIPVVVIDNHSYTILAPKKIMDNSTRKVSSNLPLIKNKDIMITFSLVTDTPVTGHSYTLLIDTNQPQNITSEEDITYLELFEMVGITYDSETDSWIKSDNGQITYYDISKIDDILPSQRNETASDGRYFILSRPAGQVHNATMIMVDAEQFPRTSTWYGDQTYEDSFKNALSFFGFTIVAEDGKWVSHINDGTGNIVTQEFTIKFSDKDNGTEILASNKDEFAQDGTYYFNMVFN